MEEVVEIEKMGSSFFVFETRVPVKYLAFIVGKFRKVDEGTDPVPVECLVSSDVAEPGRAYCGEAADILRIYSGWFGPYPFARLSIVQRLWPEGGGHSPASFILLNESPLKNNRQLLKSFNSPVDLSRWKEYFLAHEIAHQWWGQGVTWATYRDLWLSEGLAQFAAVYYLGQRYGEETFASILEKLCQWTMKKSDSGPITLGSRLSFMDYDAFQAVVYDKSALVLNMLREMVGDGPFFDGLRAFFAGRKSGPARTGQFREAMEKASGADLGPFFRGWFDSYVLPDVDVSWSEEKADGAPVLAVRIRQAKTAFVFPLWIQWQIGNKVFREKLIVDAQAKDFVLRLTGRPSKVRVNPGNAVPGKFD
jgi:aminopeptidase N